ncbi:hypothetical protein AVEN_52814-1 [Araneus ventricosus]|uniref:Uncharacterized protein n=1 Tax=Araneus ventricosus TaxID=182803 RepID=A0A4Y2RA48_ARAVE|nr:hypothetical protein AVEN_52814-1 [Araneus ventricosus]
MDLVILSRGQMTWTTPELAFPPQASPAYNLSCWFFSPPYHLRHQTNLVGRWDLNTTASVRFTDDVRFNVQQAHTRGVPLVNRVSNLEPSGPESDTLSLGHS